MGGRLGARAEAVEKGSDRRAWLTLVGTVGLGVLAFVLLAGRGVQRTDEAWFLWVTDRLSHGEVLYRNVYAATCDPEANAAAATVLAA